MKLLTTPKRRSLVWLLAVCWMLFQPFTEAVFYYTNAVRGEYPPNADAIEISIVEFAFGCFLLSPVLFGFIWFCLREYPGAVPLYAFNSSRPFWSIIWTLLFALMVFAEVRASVNGVRERYPMDVVNACFTIYLLLCLRSSVIYSTAFRKRAPTAPAA
jgi:hypothetical protein